MPLDRVITLKFQRFGFNQFNESVELAPVLTPGVWAERRNAGNSDEFTEGGVEAREVGSFTVRYFRALIVEPVRQVNLIDEYGFEWSAISVSESDHRHRFIDINAVVRTDVTQPVQ